MSADLASKAVAHLVTLVGTDPDFGPTKVFHVYSEEELLNKQKGVIFPCVGVVYDGMRSVPPAGGGSPGGTAASSAEISCTFLALFRSSPQADVDPKDSIVAQVDRLRSTIMGVRSPTGHFWRFQVEASIPGKSGVLCYLQRWATAVQLR